MSKYYNKFNIGDYVQLVVDSYSSLRYGDVYRVIGISEIGSIKLDGIGGNYNPDKFILRGAYTTAESSGGTYTIESEEIKEFNNEDNFFYLIVDGCFECSLSSKEDMQNYINERSLHGEDIMVIHGRLMDIKTEITIS